MSAPVRDNLESVMAEMLALSKQEESLYGQPATQQPGKEECPPPPEYCGPPNDPGYYHDLGDVAESSGKPAKRRATQPPPEQPAEELPAIDPMDISLCLETEPPRREFVVQDYIPAGTVGLLLGTGATGKSYLTLVMCAAVACGKSIGPFEVDEALPVVIVSAEDDAQDIHFRLRRVAEEYTFSDDEKALLGKNLIIYPARGKLGPLMGLEHQNPIRAIAADWLEGKIRLHQPGLVVLDTKSRLYGLDENSNDHGSQWVGLLESLIANHPETSILIVSHTSKASAAAGEHHATRGASSVGDNCRFGMALTWLDPREAKSLGIGDASGIIKLTHTKASYSKALEPVFLRKNAFGVPVVADVESGGALAIGHALDMLIETLREDYPEGVNRRLLERATEPAIRAIRDDVIGAALISKADWPRVIDFGIDSARLETVDDPLSAANRKPVLVRVRQFEAPNFAAEGMTQNQLFPIVLNCPADAFDN